MSVSSRDLHHAAASAERAGQDVASAAARAGQAAIDKAGDFASRASDTIDRAVDKATDLASDAADKGREAGRNLEAVAGNLKGALDKSISDQPMATLAVAAMVGFVVGALWKS